MVQFQKKAAEKNLRIINQQMLKENVSNLEKVMDIEKVNQFNLLKEEVTEFKEIKLSQWF